MNIELPDTLVTSKLVTSKLVTSERFEINVNTSTNILQQMYAVTNGFSGINVNFIAQMTEGIAKRKNTWTGFIDAPDEPVIIKQVIGKNGLHLKKITTQYAVDLIWHDRTTNKFIIWGSKQHLIKALYGLRRQITRFNLKHEELITNLGDLQLTGTSTGTSTGTGTGTSTGTSTGKRDDTHRDILEEPISKRQKM